MTRSKAQTNVYGDDNDRARKRMRMSALRGPTSMTSAPPIHHDVCVASSAWNLENTWEIGKTWNYIVMVHHPSSGSLS